MPMRWCQLVCGSRSAPSFSCPLATSSLPLSVQPGEGTSMSKTVVRSVLALVLVAALSGCSEKASLEPTQQSGSAPPLPKAQDFLLPPMQVPVGVGWAQGQSPQVAPGLKIEKIASGLMHPRQLYVLPNGDVLVAESNGPGTEPVTTPKQLIANKVKNLSGKGGKGGNRITLLRKRDTAAGEWEKH